MSSSSGSSSDSDASSGSSSSSSSDDPSSHELDQVETKQRLTLKQSKEARLSNLPPFKVPGQTDHHHHHHHHHHHKKKHHVALTKAEIEAVCSTFATFAKFTGVRLRRHDLAEQTNNRLQDSDLDRPVDTIFHLKEMKNFGDLLDPKNERIKLVQGDKQGPGTTWRSLKSSDGRRRSVEIVKHDKEKFVLEAKENSLYHPHAHKTIHCALCEKEFKKRQLMGRVSRMSVARIRRKWRGDRKHDGKHDHGKQRHTYEHFVRHGFSSAYDLTRVCIFCMQFFSSDEFDDKYDADKEEENIDWDDELVEDKVTVKLPDPISSCTLVTNLPSENKFEVKYRSSPTSWRSFQQQISVKSRKRTIINKPETNRSNKAASPRKLDFKVSKLFAAISPIRKKNTISRTNKTEANISPYAKTMREYQKKIASMK